MELQQAEGKIVLYVDPLKVLCKVLCLRTPVFAESPFASL